MRIILCDDDTAFTQVFEKRLLTVFKNTESHRRSCPRTRAWNLARLHAGRRMYLF